MTDQTEDNGAAEALATAQTNLATAEGALATAIETRDAHMTASKGTTAELKTAKGNQKKAVAFRKTLADDAEGVAEADASVTGWDAEVTRLQGVSDANKAAKTTNADAVKAAREAVKNAKAAVKEAGGSAPKAAREPKEPRVTQNGILFPLAGSKSAAVWGLLDAHRAANSDAMPDSSTLAAAAEAANAVEGAPQIKPSRIQSAVRKYRKFHGIATPVKAAAPAAEAAPAAPAAEAAPAPAEA